MENLEERRLLAGFDEPLINVPGQEQNPLFAIQPPDVAGAIGRDHFVQMVNGAGGSGVTIYDKDTGNLVQGPFTLASLAPLSSNCIFGLGDPIAMYDQDADRFVLTEFVDPAISNTLCMYISESSDPTTGTWDVYEFDTQLFPDYPKYGFSGGTYIATTNEFDSNSDPAVYAFDRENMLAGLPARPAQRVSTFPLVGFGFQALTPADVDGPLPPAGSPAYAARHVDDELHSPTSDPFNDFIEVYAFDVDFDNPANTTFVLQSRVPVGEFDSDLCNAGQDLSCVPQPATNIGLDAIPQLIMNRLQYRNFGTHETLVGSFTFDLTGNDQAAIRWFELRKDPTDPNDTWVLYQEGTQGPPDGRGRFMPSIAMDGNGNIALGYNISATDTSAKLVYTGRRASDPLGVMTQGEITVVNGSGFHDGERFGDYNTLVLDPIDDTTFWFTGEFASDGGWGTQIIAFTFGDGVVPPIDPPEAGEGTVSGTVWFDENDDGEIGDGDNGPVEHGLPRFHLYADLNDNGRLDFGTEPVAVTDDDGNYTIQLVDIPADTPLTVNIRPIFEPGWELTTPASDDFIEVTVAADEAVTDIDFGYDLDLDMGSAPAPYPQATAGRVDGFQLGDVLGVDDGFRISGNVFAGIVATAEFKVLTGGLPRGYVQMWMDFNSDGDWDDPGEQVILNERLGELPGDPWQPVSFTVPAGAASGDYQARVRFGYERFISTTDPAQAGEIEDYIVNVLGDKPVAVNDFFQFPQGVVDQFMDVLANDQKSSNGDIRIVGFTQPGNGATVSLAPGGLSLTAAPNFFSPPVLTFEYTIADMASPPNTSTATVEVFMEASFDDPIAVDDSYIRTATVFEDPLPVLANDIPGTSPPIVISDITVDPVMGGTAVIDGSDILYTPPSDTFVGTDTFQYEIRNSDSPTVTDTAWVTIQVGQRPTTQDKVIITLEATHPVTGLPLTSIMVGSDFNLNVYLQDIRQPDRFREGVFAAYLDILYDANLTSVNTSGGVLGFEVTFDPLYGEGPTGNATVPNIIDEFGSFSTSDNGVGDGRLLMASIGMTAEAVGLAEFKGDPADIFPESLTLLFGTNTPVNALTEIVYVFDDLMIVDGVVLPPSADMDTNNDDVVSPSDVLAVINFLNSNGPTALPNFASGGEGESSGRGPDSLSELDTNADRFISAVDALVIINFLNARSGGGEGEGEGEGEGSPLYFGEGEAADRLGDLTTPIIAQPSTAGIAPEPKSEPLIPRRRLASSFAPAVVETPRVARTSRFSLPSSVRDLEQEALDAVLGDLAEDIAEAWRS